LAINDRVELIDRYPDDLIHGLTHLDPERARRVAATSQEHSPAAG
jgi:hypothetical protein